MNESREWNPMSHHHTSASNLHRISPLLGYMETSGELDLEGIDDQEIEKVRWQRVCCLHDNLTGCILVGCVEALMSVSGGLWTVHPGREGGGSEDGVVDETER